MLIYILGGLAAFVLVLCIIAALRPHTTTTTRSRTMPAAPTAILELVRDFRAWRQWSPWEDIDADLQRSYSGADAGPGAKYAWQGKKAGAGDMTVRQEAVGEEVIIDLNFTKPFAAKNVTTISCTKTAQGTLVTWTMVGETNFLFRLMGLFINFDKLIGKDFEKGLAGLERVTASTVAA